MGLQPGTTHSFQNDVEHAFSNFSSEHMRHALARPVQDQQRAGMTG